MGLGSFFNHLVAPIEHHLGHGLTNVLFPTIPLNKLVFGGIDLALQKAGSLGARNSAGTQTIHQGGAGFGPAPAYNVTYGAPNYGGFGGGGGYQSYDSFQGGSPWEYSTPSFQPSIQPYPVYSAVATPPADRSWEDLIAAAAPLFL